jgi:hypothetical protein
MNQLHPDIIAEVQSKALYSKEEESLLGTVASVGLYLPIALSVLLLYPRSEAARNCHICRSLSTYRFASMITISHSEAARNSLPTPNLFSRLRDKVSDSDEDCLWLKPINIINFTLHACVLVI